MNSLFSAAPGTSADIDGSAAWIRMVASLLLATMGGAAMWSMVVVLPEVQAEFGLDRGTASLAYTSMMAGFAIGNLVFGRAIDRLGAALPVAVGSVMLAAGFILGSFAAAFWQFLILQGVLIGIGSVARFGPILADISHWFKRRRGIAVTAVACGNYIAGAFWPLAMQPMMAAGGWRLSYFLMGLICIVVSLPLAAMLRRQSPHLSAEASALPQSDLLYAGIPPKALMWVLMFAGVACCIAMAMPQVHIVAYCVDLGFGVARGSEMLAIMAAAGIVSRLVSGWLADRIGGVKTLLIGSTGQMLALCLYLPFDGLVSLYTVSLIFGLSQGGIIPMYAIVVREYMPAREAGSRVGFIIMATIVGMALGGWVSGEIYDLTGSYQAAFLNGIAWNLANMVIIGMIIWRSRPRSPVHATAA